MNGSVNMNKSLRVIQQPRLDLSQRCLHRNTAGSKNSVPALKSSSLTPGMGEQFLDAKRQKKEPTAKFNAQSLPSEENISAERMAAQSDQGCSQIKEERNRLPASPSMGAKPPQSGELEALPARTLKD
jgi:hypothetical protein